MECAAVSTHAVRRCVHGFQVASDGASVETIVVGSSTTTSVVATVSVEAIDVSDELEESSPPHAVSASMPKIEIAAPKRSNECDTCRDVIEDPPVSSVRIQSPIEGFVDRIYGDDGRSEQVARYRYASV